MGDASDIITLDQPFSQVPHFEPRKLNVGVVGLGRMGRRHAINVLRLVPRANLLCACSPTEADLVWAAEHIVPHRVQVFDSFEKMIQMPGLDAVVIASATEYHMEHTLAAMDRGIHVLCEKPICATEGEVSLLRGTDLRLYTDLWVAADISC